MQKIFKHKLIPQIATALIAALIAAPILLNLLFIYRYGVNCVFWDQWNIVPLFDKLYSGNLSFADLFAQHNEHRILLPRLAMLGLGSLTHYNTKAEMYFAWFLLCITCFILFKLFVRLFGFSKLSMAKFIPVVWLVFGLRQYDNLLWGFQLVYFMVVLFFLLAVYLLAESKRFDWRFGLAILCGLASTFSLAGGLLVWPIGLIQILLTDRTQAKRLWGLDIVKSITWAITGIAVYILYFTGYTQPQHTVNPLYSLQHPGIAGMFGLVAIGNPLNIDQYTAASIGMLLLILYIIVGIALFYRPQAWKLKSPFFSLVLFAVTVAGVLAITRAEWGEGTAMVSRYATMTVMGVIGLYALTISLDLQNINYKYFLSGFLCSLVVGGLLVTDIAAYFSIGYNMHSERRLAAYYLETYQYQSDENLGKLLPWPDVVREQVPTLIKYKLNVFSGPLLPGNDLKPLSTEPLFYIEEVNGKRPPSQEPVSLQLAGVETLRIKGWAIDQNNGKAAGNVLVVIDGKLEVPALNGLDRPDIAVFHKNNNYRYSGFEVALATSLIGPGQHDISIKVISADGKDYYRPVKILTIDIK